MLKIPLKTVIINTGTGPKLDSIGFRSFNTDCYEHKQGNPYEQCVHNLINLINKAVDYQLCHEESTFEDLVHMSYFEINIEQEDLLSDMGDLKFAYTSSNIFFYDFVKEDFLVHDTYRSVMNQYALRVYTLLKQLCPNIFDDNLSDKTKDDVHVILESSITSLTMQYAFEIYTMASNYIDSTDQRRALKRKYFEANGESSNLIAQMFEDMQMDYLNSTEDK